MNKSVKYKFLVLVPHKDVRAELNNYWKKLTKNGLIGVYHFPLVVPLASLFKSLTEKELKQIAFLLRQIAGKSKINSTDTSAITFPAEENKLSLFGPRLDLELPAGIFDDCSKIQTLCSPLVIGTFLNPDSSFRVSLLPQLEKLPFRAAAVANMYWQAFNDGENTAFNWKIGKLSWLPKKPAV